MNKTIFYALALAATMTACSSGADEVAPSNGMGRLNVRLNAEAEFALTRALNESAYTNAANYTVEVKDRDGQVVKTIAPGENLANSFELPFGTYTVRASYGVEHDASRDEFLCEDTKTVNVVSGEEAHCSLVCEPTCGKAVVKFGAEMATYFDNYYVTYQTRALGGNVATWEKDDAEPWYLLVDKAGETVTATIHLTPKAEYDVNKTHTEGTTAEGTVVKTHVLRPNQSWTLNIAPNYSQTTGKLGITIEIDESTNDKEVGIEIPSEWI